MASQLPGQAIAPEATEQLAKYLLKAVDDSGVADLPAEPEAVNALAQVIESIVVMASPVAPSSVAEDANETENIPSATLSVLTSSGPRSASKASGPPVIELTVATTAANVIQKAAKVATKLKDGLLSKPATSLVNAISLLIGTCAEQAEVDDSDPPAEQADADAAVASTTLAREARQFLVTENKRLRAVKKNKQAALSNLLRRATAAIGDAMAVTVKEGETLQVVSSGMKLSVRKESPKELSRKGAGLVPLWPKILKQLEAIGTTDFWIFCKGF